MVDHAEYRVEQRVQRSLVIITAKTGPPLDEDDDEAIVKHYNQAKYLVLLKPELVKMICEYMDWKPFKDEVNFYFEKCHSRRMSYEIE